MTKKTKNKNIAVIGGGTGTFMVLTALKENPVNLAAVVSMADDGGSTGLLRDQYGALPPGDIRRALVALSGKSDTMRELFNYRFGGRGELAGHNLGNLFLSALEKIKGNFASAVSEASKVLNVKGKVLPVTLDNTRLYARLASGTVIKGETKIDIPRGNRSSKISRVWLKPEAKINPSAERALKEADMIIMGPGDLFTSLIPNLLVKGVPEAIKSSKAKKVFVCNLMTKYGETHGFGAEDFVNEIEKYLGAGALDYAVFNSKKPGRAILAKYREEKSEFISPPNVKHRVSNKPEYILADLLDSGPFVRHNPRRKLAQVLTALL